MDDLEEEIVESPFIQGLVKKTEDLIAEVAIPWTDLSVSDVDITNGNLMTLSEKLARTSFYIVQINNRLTRLLALHAAVKETLEHAVNRSISQDEDGRKLTKDVRVAAIISDDPRLRSLKIQLIESTSCVKALETTKDSLDTLWRTTSRIMSARLKEPLD